VPTVVPFPFVVTKGCERQTGRRESVGDLGERWTIALLRNAGFHSVKDLNTIKYDHPGVISSQREKGGATS
jgi:hypothetical protein